MRVSATITHMENHDLTVEQSQAIEEMVHELNFPAGYDIEEVSLTVKSNSTVVVQIVLDKDGGIGIDNLGKLHIEMADLLHEKLENILGSQREYEIEFTSRGVNSPLSLLRHWRRNLGRKVRIKLKDNSQVIARIARINDSEDSVTLVLHDQGALLQKDFSLDNIKSAKIEIEFNAPNAAEMALCDSLEEGSSH